MVPDGEGVDWILCLVKYKETEGKRGKVTRNSAKRGRKYLEMVISEIGVDQGWSMMRD